MPGKVVPLKAFRTPTVGFYPTLSKKASSFPYVAGGSVPSQLEAFKFKTKQNNPFLGSFFLPIKHFCEESNLSREIWQSKSRKQICKCFLCPSQAPWLLCWGGCFSVTSWGGQQISWPSGYSSQASLGQQKEALSIFKLSWGQSFLLTKDGQLGTDSSLIFLFVLCCWAPHLTEPAHGATGT